MSRPHPDDLQLLRRRAAAPMPPMMTVIGGAGVLLAMLDVCEALEPQLVFTEDADRVSWRSAVAQLRFRMDQWRMIGTHAGGVEPDTLDALVDLLEQRSEPVPSSLMGVIGACGPSGLKVLDARAVKVADTVRDARSFVHPAKERETLRGQDFARSEAIVAQALVEQVIEAVRAAAPAR